MPTAAVKPKSKSKAPSTRAIAAAKKSSSSSSKSKSAKAVVAKKKAAPKKNKAAKKAPAKKVGKKTAPKKKATKKIAEKKAALKEKAAPKKKKGKPGAKKISGGSAPVSKSTAKKAKKASTKQKSVGVAAAKPGKKKSGAVAAVAVAVAATEKKKNAPRAKSVRGSKSTSSAPGFGRKSAGFGEGGDDFSGKVTQEMMNEISEKKGELETFTLTHLKALLRCNFAKVSGVKSELVSRCAEHMVMGCVPRCPECNGGRPRLISPLKVGEEQRFKCPGYYDEDHYAYCHWKGTLKRTPWNDLPENF